MDYEEKLASLEKLRSEIAHEGEECASAALNSAATFIQHAMKALFHARDQERKIEMVSTPQEAARKAGAPNA